MSVNDETPRGFQVGFSENLTAPDRAIAERSVQAHIAHVTQARAERRRITDGQAKAASAVNAPLAKLVEADPAAAKSLTDAADRRRELLGQLDIEAPTFPRTRDLPLDLMRVANDGVADQIFPIPYHFDWRWHRGAEGSSSADRSTGEVTVGTTVDDVDFSDVHAGVGVLMRPTEFRRVKARSLRSSWESYLVAAGGFGGDATAEGGMEMTILEDGQLLSSAQDKRFRKRLSDGESDQWDSGGFGTGDAIEVACLMTPGREYTINVGAWVYCEQHGGFGIGGDSWAVAKVTAKVIFISLFDFT
jgi:hypothetical protein